MMERPAAAKRRKHGRYITLGDSIMVRVPGTKQENFPNTKTGLVEAKMRRDELAKEQGIRLTGPTLRCMKPKPRQSTKAIEEAGLPDGVTYTVEVRNDVEYFRYVVRWSEGPVTKRRGRVKTFAVLKRGRDIARAMAIEFRQEMKQKHYR